MYPITCHGGYPIPIALGKMEIMGISITGSDTTAVSRITVVDNDDFACITDTDLKKPTLVDLKGDTLMGVLFEEPIKTRKGVNVTNLTNVIPGKVMVYVR